MSAHPDFSAFKVNPKYWTILNSIIEWNVDTVTVAQITTKHHLRLSTVAQAFDEFVKRGVLKEVKKPKSDVPVYKLTEAVKKAYVAPPAPKYESKNENMWSDRGELTDTCYQALYDGAKSIDEIVKVSNLPKASVKSVLGWLTHDRYVVETPAGPKLTSKPLVVNLERKRHWDLLRSLAHPDSPRNCVRGLNPGVHG